MIFNLIIALPFDRDNYKQICSIIAMSLYMKSRRNALPRICHAAFNISMPEAMLLDVDIHIRVVCVSVNVNT